ncbi:MAG: hypothetical protein DWI29_03875 [Planctomycetota bacterium]|nr:MAG: hypothetical protein DWI29_03875 [Planctomycetota bacterium]
MAGLRCPSHGRSGQSGHPGRPSAEGRSCWLNLLRKILSFSIPNRFYPGTLRPLFRFLFRFTWQIYEGASADAEFPKVLVTAAAAATEKALVTSPKSGMILDTLAHLVHHQGKLDRAIELQTQALANSADLSDEGKKEMQSFLQELKKEKTGK